MKIRAQITVASLVVLTFMGLLVLGTGWFFIHNTTRMQIENLMLRDIDTYFRDFKEVESLLQNWGVRDSVFLNRWQNEHLNTMSFYRFNNSGRAIVINRDGQILSRRTDETYNANPPSETIQTMLEEENGSIRVRHDDHWHFIVFRRFDPWGWTIGVSVEERELYRRENLFMLEAALLILGFVLLMTALFNLLSRRFVNRIHDMQNCTEAIRLGEMDLRIEGRASHDELGDLHRNINNMADTISLRTREWLEAAAALRESEETYRTLIESSRDAIYLYYKGSFEITNRRFQGIFGDNPSDSELSNLTPGVSADGRLEPNTRIEQTRRFTVSDQQGQNLEIEASFAILPHKEGYAVQGVLRDITPRRRLEEQLRQSQKLEAIGTLAGGIAHDFNNILSIILGYCDYGKIETEEGSELNGVFDEIGKAGVRAKDLVRQILTFSRQSKQNYTDLQLSNLLEETLTMLRSSLPSTVELIREIHSSASVHADATEMHQMIMNLVTNAYQALPQGQGRIIVRLIDFEADDIAPDVRNQLQNDRCVMLRVEDSGAGISPENLERIFDPFFTTRETGKGTGLGLAIIHGIVNRTRGIIRVDSKLGEGTTFSIYLPACESAEEDIATSDQSMAAMYRGRILLVDDEEAITELFSRALTRMGYEVDAFNDSALALDTFSDSPERWNALVTDMTMPKMTGIRLAEKALTLRPDLPVILCTGYSEHVTQLDIERVGVRELLNKPMSPKELAAVIFSYIVPSEDS